MYPKAREAMQLQIGKMMKYKTLFLLSVVHSGCATQEQEKSSPQCNAGTKWTEGTVAFKEVTNKWNITDDIIGNRISSVDYDGDGWIDLFVRTHSSNGDDFSDGGTRVSWLLRNQEGQGFEDVTQSSGIRQLRLGGQSGRPGSVAIFGDIDNDGDLDVYTGRSSFESNGEGSEVLFNNGDGTFSLGPEDSEIRDEDASIVAGASFTDINLDGKIDLWTTQGGVGNPAQDKLFWGTGDGYFTDVTRPFELRTKSWSAITDLNEAKAHTQSWSANACDLNNDGFPDLLSASYGRAPNHLWHNNAGETFTNQSIQSNYAFDHREDWSDNESARCYCKFNTELSECNDVPEPEYISCNNEDDAFRWDHSYDMNPFRLGGNSGTTVCADINNDGWMDLLTTEIVHWDVGQSSDPSEILFNTQSPDIIFDRPGNESTGLTREHNIVDWNDGDISGGVFDFDNDGWPDVYIGSTDYPETRGLLFHQDSQGQFVPVPIEDGIDHTRSHGIVYADFDNDGDLDVVVGHSSARCDADCYETFNIRMFENQLGEESNWIQLKLTGGNGSNTAAIGAQVTTQTDSTTQKQEVNGGFGHYGAQNPLLLHFGLGEECTANVTIRWPNAAQTEQTFSVDANNRYSVTQGKNPEVIPR